MSLKPSQRSMIVGLAFCSPLIVGLAVFTVYPVAASFYFSLCDYPIFDPPQFIGLANYREMFEDPRIYIALYNTFIYAILGIPVGMVCGLGLAMLLNVKVKGMAVYRTVFFLPSVVPMIASCVLWLQVLNPQNGLLNRLLRSVGIPESQIPGWFLDPDWSKIALIIMGLWGCGGGMVMYLAALQDVPVELYESAEIDGAGPLRRFRHITIPMISPILLFTLVMGMIGTLQYFAQAYVMTGGGPLDSTLFYSLYLFNVAFSEYKLGYSSAMAWVMFIVILICTFIVMRVSNKVVYYRQ
ncbi:MAG TPA: sugar ABC transporter permease [Candidatus Brocadiia bacterium]|nr:sugar ABC transporter permease [Candidatus Brocadiia bacterium]